MFLVLTINHFRMIDFIVDNVFGCTQSIWYCPINQINDDHDDYFGIISIKTYKHWFRFDSRCLFNNDLRTNRRPNPLQTSIIPFIIVIIPNHVESVRFWCYFSYFFLWTIIWYIVVSFKFKFICHPTPN